MLGRLVCVCLVMALGCGVQADPPSKPQPPPPAGRSPRKQVKDNQARPPTNRAVKAMKLVIEDAEFDEMPFEDFTEWLARKTKANVVVRWKVLDKAGVERDYPITLKQKRIRLRKLIPLVFGQVTEELRDVELAAKADGNTLIISTRKDINAKLIVKTYDVQDLLMVVPNFAAGITALHVDQVRHRRSGIGDSGSAEGTEDPDKPVQELIKLITEIIQPLSWKANGGRGTIVMFKGRLVIRNNVEVHQQLADLLGEPDRDT